MPVVHGRNVVFLLTEDVYVSGIWMVGCSTFDVLGMLSRPMAGGPWNYRYRFRYHNDDKVFDSEDTRRIFDVTDSPSRTRSEDEWRAKIDGMTAALSLATGGDVEFIDVRGSGVQAGEKLKTLPWAHMKKVERDPPD